MLTPPTGPVGGGVFSDPQLNGFLDRLADQVHNAGLLGSLFGSGERAPIYADDLAAFLKDRPR